MECVCNPFHALYICKQNISNIWFFDPKVWFVFTHRPAGRNIRRSPLLSHGFELEIARGSYPGFISLQSESCRELAQSTVWSWGLGGGDQLM